MIYFIIFVFCLSWVIVVFLIIWISFSFKELRLFINIIFTASCCFVFRFAVRLRFIRVLVRFDGSGFKFIEVLVRLIIVFIQDFICSVIAF